MIPLEMQGRPRAFTNASGEKIPAFAVMAVSSDANLWFTATKPNAGSMKNIAVNGPVDIPDEADGYCYEHGTVQVLYENGTPGDGEGWGTVSGSWKINPSQTGFVIYGGASGGRVGVRFFSGSLLNTVRFAGVATVDAANPGVNVSDGSQNGKADFGDQYAKHALLQFATPLTVVDGYTSLYNFAISAVYIDAGSGTTYYQVELNVTNTLSATYFMMVTRLFSNFITEAFDYSTVTWATKPTNDGANRQQLNTAMQLYNPNWRIGYYRFTNQPLIFDQIDVAIQRQALTTVYGIEFFASRLFYKVSGGSTWNIVETKPDFRLSYPNSNENWASTRDPTAI